MFEAFLTTVIEPFTFEFMNHAFLVGALVVLPMSLISCFLVLKGWSLMGDAISHAVLPGIVLSIVVGIPMQIGAFISGLICVSVSGYLNRTSRIKEDTAMGIVFAGMFGFGLVLFRKIDTDLHLDHVLFGDLLGVAWSDIYTSLLIAVLVTACVWVLRKDLLLLSFDEQHAKAIGFRTGLLHYGLMAMVALVIVSALNAVGMVLAIAVLIAPGVTAYLLTKRFNTMMIIAALVGCASSFLGTYISFFVDSAPAPTIVLVMTACFILAYTWHKFANATKTRRLIKA